MDEFGLWLSIAGLAIVLIGHWVRVNTRITAMEIKAAADKITCDASLTLIRTEAVAIEARGLARVGDLREQLSRIDGKVDRLLQRAGHE